MHFFRSIGRRDETLFRKERLLEKAISESILTCPEDQRDSAYREAYNKLHKFMITVASGEHLTRAQTCIGQCGSKTSFISPVNVLVNVEVKLLFQKLFENTSFVYPITGVDPIVLIAFNQKQD